MILLEIILLYCFLFFVLAPLVLPHLWYKRRPLPRQIPQFWKDVIDVLNRSSHSDKEFLQNAYTYITNRHQGDRLKTITKFPLVFSDPLRSKPGFLHCTLQNYLLRLILVKSGRFGEEDIRIRVMFFDFSIHQYLQVRLGDVWLTVDPWAKGIGIPLGKRLPIFG